MLKHLDSQTRSLPLGLLVNSRRPAQTSYRTDDYHEHAQPGAAAATAASRPAERGGKPEQVGATTLQDAAAATFFFYM